MTKKEKVVETHVGIGLSYVFGAVLILGGIFSLPIGLLFILLGLYLISNANKKVEKIKKK